MPYSSRTNRIYRNNLSAVQDEPALRELIKSARAAWTRDVKSAAELQNCNHLGDAQTRVEAVSTAAVALESKAQNEKGIGEQAKEAMKRQLRLRVITSVKRDLEAILRRLEDQKQTLEAQGRRPEVVTPSDLAPGAMPHRLTTEQLETLDKLDLDIESIKQRTREVEQDETVTTANLNVGVPQAAAEEAREKINHGSYASLIDRCVTATTQTALQMQPSQRARLVAIADADQALEATTTMSPSAAKTTFQTQLDTIEPHLDAPEEYKQTLANTNRVSELVPEFDPYNDTDFSSDTMPLALEELAEMLNTVRAHAAECGEALDVLSSKTAAELERKQAVRDLNKAQGKMSTALISMNKHIVDHKDGVMRAVHPEKMEEICLANSAITEELNLKVNDTLKKPDQPPAFAKYALAALIFPPAIPFMAAYDLFSRHSKANLPTTKSSGRNSITYDPDFAKFYGQETSYTGAIGKGKGTTRDSMSDIVLPLDGVKSNDPEAKGLSIREVVNSLPPKARVTLTTGKDGSYQVKWKDRRGREAYNKAIHQANDRYLKFKAKHAFKASMSTQTPPKVNASMTNAPFGRGSLHPPRQLPTGGVEQAEQLQTRRALRT